MASLGHIVVGLAAARGQRADAMRVQRASAAGVEPADAPRGNADRLRWPAMIGWSALSMLPDADVVGFSLGVRYADPWGHRGATHSVLFAVAVGACVGVAAYARQRQVRPNADVAADAIVGVASSARKRSARRLWILATLVLVSHGLLDTLTDGGLGCALWWPFDLTRYFAPWRPIPVAPIGLAFFSPYGLFVALSELALFAPLLVYATRFRRMSAVGFCLWAVAVWLIGSSDPVRQSLLGTVLREHTEYAPAFSEAAFRSVRAGESEADVRRRLGAPFGEFWTYVSFDEPPNPAAEPPCPFVYLESDRVVVMPRDVGPVSERCERAGAGAGTSRIEVQRVLGPPREVCATYTRGTPRRYHRMRMVCFAGGTVSLVVSAWQPF